MVMLTGEAALLMRRGGSYSLSQGLADKLDVMPDMNERWAACLYSRLWSHEIS